MSYCWNETNTYEQWQAFKPSLLTRAELFTGVALTSTGPHARRIMPELLAEWPHFNRAGKPRVTLFLKPGTVAGVTTPDQASSWAALADYFTEHAPDCDWGIDAETWGNDWIASEPDAEAIETCAAGIHSLAMQPGRFLIYGFGLWPGPTHDVRLRIFKAIFGEHVRSLFRDDGRYVSRVVRPDLLALAEQAAAENQCDAYTKINASGWPVEDVAAGLREKRWPTPVLVYGASAEYVGLLSLST